jgi:uncharacterized membrane protein
VQEVFVHFETTVNIDAPLDTVWATLIDLGRWPEWTESIQEVSWLEGGALAKGSRVRIKQPSIPAQVWVVSEVQPGASFSWTSKALGVTTLGCHALTQAADGHVTVTLGIDQSGLLAPVMGLLAGARARRYVQMEADGLKKRSEEWP